MPEITLSALEAPVGGSIGLCRTESKDCVWSYLVDIPGGRSGTRSTVWSSERLPIVGDSCGPTLLRIVYVRYTLNQGCICHPRGLPLYDDIEIVCGDCEDTMGILREILC